MSASIASSRATVSRARPDAKVAHFVGRRLRVGPLVPEERVDGALDVAAADVPLIENLQRGLAARAGDGLSSRAR